MTHHGPIDLAFVQRVIDAELPETQELEYKRQQPKKVANPTRADQSRSDPLEEFAKDVSAMANASGGVLLYGLAEDPETQKPTLYPISDETYDQAQVRLHSLLDNLIEPRLMGVEFFEIPVAGGYVMGILVPGSFAGPHWYGRSEKRRFSIRRGARVSEFTYQELRAAFDRNASATAQARRWIADRVAAIKGDQTWRRMTIGPKVIVHLVPLVAYTQQTDFVDPNQARQMAGKFPSPWKHGYTHEVNFDGLVIYPRDGTYRNFLDLIGYTQVFRDGSIEVVMFTRPENNPDPDTKDIRPPNIARTVHDSILKAPSALQSIGKLGPTMVGVSLIGTSGYELPDQTDTDSRAHHSDRNDLTVPPLFVEDPQRPDELERAAKTALTMLWQGFGFPECPYYDAEGNYRHQA